MRDKRTPIRFIRCETAEDKEKAQMVLDTVIETLEDIFVHLRSMTADAVEGDTELKEIVDTLDDVYEAMLPPMLRGTVLIAMKDDVDYDCGLTNFGWDDDNETGEA